MALSLFNDPFFSESRLTPMGNMFGSSIFDTGLGNMGIQNRMMTAMPLRVTETDDKFKVSKNNYNDNFHVTQKINIIFIIYIIIYIYYITITLFYSSYDFNYMQVLAEIPGVTSKKDVAIKVDQGVLSITAEKKKEKVPDTEILHREEVQYGKLVRSIRIPDYVIPNNSRAVLNDGVLEISFEKEPPMKDQALHIPIE